MACKRFLAFHGQQWRVQVAVPAKLKPAFEGRANLVHPLHVDTLDKANSIKWPIIARFKADIEAARRAYDVPRGDSTPQAAALRSIGRTLEAKYEARHGDEQEAAEQAINAHSMRVGETFRALLDDGDEEEANAFLDTACSVWLHAKPALTEQLENWIADQGYIRSTAYHHRRALGVLRQWCLRSKVDVSDVGKLDRAAARAFLEKRLLPQTRTRKTLTKYLSSYRSYWDWLVDRKVLLDNPWIGVRPPKRFGLLSEENEPRPFTNDEVAALVAGHAPGRLLRDAMLVAALAGARIDAVCSLTVKDCAGGKFRMKRMKKERRCRLVPIHPDLATLVAERCAGKRPDASLFHECDAFAEGKPRSAPVVQAFTRYRRKLGVDDRVSGQRNARATFHSFRRWFITEAERAGQPPHIIEAVVGHQRAGMSMGLYSGGPSDEQRRACVEAVKLPVNVADLREVGPLAVKRKKAGAKSLKVAERMQQVRD